MRKANTKRLKQLEVEMAEMCEKLRKAKRGEEGEGRRNLKLYNATQVLLGEFSHLAIKHIQIFRVRPGVPASTKKMYKKLSELDLLPMWQAFHGRKARAVVAGR